MAAKKKKTASKKGPFGLTTPFLILTPIASYAYILAVESVALMFGDPLSETSTQYYLIKIAAFIVPAYLLYQMRKTKKLTANQFMYVLVWVLISIFLTRFVSTNLFIY